MKKVLVLPLFVALTLSGCASTGESSDSSRTATGAILGGIVGGIVAHNTGDSSSRTRTAVGAVAGAAVGGAIGHSMDEKERKIREIAAERDASEMEVERLRDDLLRVSVSSEASFDFDRSDLKPEFKPTLDRVARVLRGDPGLRITIIGFTDSVGSEAYNLRLSQRRAEATAAYLASQGVSSSQIATEGLGEAEPRASNATEAGRAQNRRVEIYLQQT